MTERPRLADAAAVLGCALSPGGVPTRALELRVEHGVALFRQGLVSRVIFTGGHTRPGPSEAAASVRLARSLGLPESAVLFEERSVNTYGNLLEVSRIVREHGLVDVAVVTEPWHLPRAMVLARYVGLRAVGAPSRSSTEGDLALALRRYRGEALRLPLEWALCALRCRERFYGDPPGARRG